MLNASALPPVPFREADDETVKLLALQLGIIDRLKEPPAGHSRVLIYTVEDHKTHWLTFARHAGHANPADNGFELHAWPKALFSQEDWEEALYQYKQRLGLVTESYQKVRPPRPYS